MTETVWCQAVCHLGYVCVGLVGQGSLQLLLATPQPEILIFIGQRICGSLFLNNAVEIR